MANPVVTSLTPSSGPTSGGYACTIHGSHFLDGTLNFVLFGGVVASSPVVVNDTTITCVVPAHSVAQAVHVIVYESQGASSASPADLFTYTATSGGSGPSGTPTATGVTLSGLHTSAEYAPFRLADATTRYVFFSKSGSLWYESSPDGTTWGAAAAVTGAPTWATIIGLAVEADTLYIWSTATNGIKLSTITLSGGTIGTLKSVTYTYAQSGFSSFIPLAVRFDGTYWHVAVKATQTATGLPFLFLSALAVSFVANPTGPIPVLTDSGMSQVGSRSIAVRNLDMAISGTDVFLGIIEGSLKKFVVYRMIYAAPAGTTNGSYGGTGISELNYSYVTTTIPDTIWVQAIALDIDLSGNLDVVVRDGASVLAMKRTATNSYGQAYQIDTQAETTSPMSLARDGSSGTLFLFYVSKASGLTYGEIWTSLQVGGAWYQPQVLNGGAGGYWFPSANPDSISGEIDLVFQIGTSPTSGTLVYEMVSTATPPQVPQQIGPSGPVDVANIVFSWRYSNVTPNNPQGWYHLQVLDPFDTTNTPIWDSGTVHSAAASVIYGGPTLTPGDTFVWQVEVGDSITDGGAGLSSGWSNRMAFVPTHVPTVTIDAIQFGGNTYTTPPTTVDVSDLIILGAYHQVDSHPANADIVFIYPSPITWTLTADGAGAVARTPVHSEAPYLLDGDAFSMEIDATGQLADATDYEIVLAVVDSVTGLVGFSTPFAVHTDFPPPSAVTAPSYTIDELRAAITLSWTNPAGLHELRVERAPHGTTDWQVLCDGAPITTYTAYPPLTQAFDYRVVAVNGSGLEATATVASNVIVGANAIGVIIQDAMNPDLFIWLGAVDSWDATKFHMEEDIQSYVALNAEKPIAKIGPTNYWTASGLQFFIPALDLDVNGDEVLGINVVNAFTQIKLNGEALWRDRTGFSVYGLVTNFYKQSMEDIHFDVTFDWLGTDPPPGAIA